MKLFSELFRKLDSTNKTNEKIDALVEYFNAARTEDAAWAVSFLIGRKPRQIVPTKKLRLWSAEAADIPDWLFDESYDVVGDLAETITLLLPDPESTSDVKLKNWVEERLLPLKDLEETEQRKTVLSYWDELNTEERFVVNKLITGGFRIGVSQQNVVKALSKFSGIDSATLSHRLMGDWYPDKSFFENLVSHEVEDADISRPYPFYLAYALEGEVEDLGNLNEWFIEWKWDGIRCQIIKREDEVFIWSRGEDLITEQFPELKISAEKLENGTVLDGELLPYKNDKPMPFGELQKRLGRKNLSKKILEEVPTSIICYDILEHKYSDIRNEILSKRREILEETIERLKIPRFLISTKVETESWEELKILREESRERFVEGFMLKRKESLYQVGRKKGDWWKWKIDPLTVDAVLIYAQKGHGKRANLYTDYTFGVWDNGELVPFAKAYSGLTDEEIRKVDNFVKRNTLEKFGPVRTVKPELVFEIAFEGIRKSNRHKSGVAVRFPRINRWRKDKKMEEADNLESVKTLIKE